MHFIYFRELFTVKEKKESRARSFRLHGSIVLSVHFSLHLLPFSVVTSSIVYPTTYAVAILYILLQQSFSRNWNKWGRLLLGLDSATLIPEKSRLPFWLVVYYHTFMDSCMIGGCWSIWLRAARRLSLSITQCFGRERRAWLSPFRGWLA